MRPKHVAIIPDGNRRWAKKHGITLLESYDKGIAHIANVLKWCRKYRVRELTMWGFSMENFLRDRKEVSQLFKLFNQKLSEGMRHDYEKYKVRVRFMGRIDELPREVSEKMRQVERDTAKHKNYRLNLMLAYGGRREILDAVNRALSQRMGRVDEKSFANLLYTSGASEPDLVIRTSGEVRTSGFLPWQSAYSEYHFSRKLWPDFSERDFKRALDDYSRRRRKYGK